MNNSPVPLQENFGVKSWKVMVVDDEPSVHQVSSLVFNRFEFKGKEIEVIDCFSAAEAFEVLKVHTDIALILLDVMMETDDAGLELVKKIRGELNMNLIRIVLRTGNPGYAPETKIIKQYDINDYQTKTDLTMNRLTTVVTANLRAYDSLLTIERMRLDLEDRVRERTMELEKSNQLKDKLFSVIAHDLRGPIGNIRGFLDLLKDAEENEDTTEIDTYIKIMKSSAEAVTTLLDNLLVWARSQRHALILKPHTSGVATIIDAVVELFNGIASSKDIVIKRDVPKRCVAFCDDDLVSLIIRNLLANAIKFTPRGGTVTISIENHGDQLRVSIADTGIGMEKEQLERLLGNQELVSTYGTEQEKGSGLGIMLSRECLSLHGTKLEAQSSPGKGTVMSFNLGKTSLLFELTPEQEENR